MTNLLHMHGRPTLDPAAWERARLVLEAAKKGGLQIKDLAKAVGVKAPSVSNWINNKNRPTAENLIAALRFVGADPALVIPEIIGPAAPAPADLDDRLRRLAEMLVLRPDTLIAAGSTADSRIVWDDLPMYVRRGAMAAVYLWGHPIEAVCRAAHEVWSTVDADDIRRLGEEPESWARQIDRKLPDRPKSGTMPSVLVGDLTRRAR